MTDLLYSEEEEALRAAVRDLLTDQCDPHGVIERDHPATAGHTPMTTPPTPRR